MSKIGLCGAHSSGKSTLALSLNDRLLSSEIVSSVARTCPFPINENRNLDTQNWIIVSRIQREIEQSKNTKKLICERTVLDDFVYFTTMDIKYIEDGNIQVGSNIYSEDELSQYIDFQKAILFSWIPTYDHLFYLDPLPLVNDGVRPMDKIFHEKIVNTFDVWINVLENKGIKFHRLPICSIEERVDMVLKKVL